MSAIVRSFVCSWCKKAFGVITFIILVQVARGRERGSLNGDGIFGFEIHLTKVPLSAGQRVIVGIPRLTLRWPYTSTLNGMTKLECPVSATCDRLVRTAGHRKADPTAAKTCFSAATRKRPGSTSISTRKPLTGTEFRRASAKRTLFEGPQKATHTPVYTEGTCYTTWSYKKKRRVLLCLRAQKIIPILFEANLLNFITHLKAISNSNIN